jgi:hypothetical protein
MDHLFIVKIPGMDRTALAINPTATINAGTQRFTQSQVTKQGGVLGGLGGGTVTNSQNVNRFSILSYEVSMPVVFVVHEYYFALTPAYVMPQNLIVVPGRPDLSEYGKNLFFVTATAGMRLQFR